MKSLFSSFLLFLGGISSLFAQNPTQTIRGQVIDSEAKVPLGGATVVILNSQPLLGNVTGAEGNFRIDNVPVGRHTLKISFVGYEDALLSEILVGSGKEVVLNIPLAESFQKMEEVVIAAEEQKGNPNNEMTTVSARSFSVEETKRYAAAINDPARMALSFAGVAANDDSGNEIIIRGNSPRGLLWRLEGIEIPNPNHFSSEGASGGAVSVLSVNMLDNSDFLTGAFPAEYGNASSGVFDIKLRRGNNQKREYAIQAGFLGMDFAAEGYFNRKSKASYLVNYRYSTLSILKAIGLDLIGESVPNFQDLSFKLNFPTQKSGVFSIWGISGLSRQNIEAKRDTLQWEDTGDRFEEKIKTGMWATGMSHLIYLNNKTYLESALSFSGTLTQFSADSLSKSYQSFLVERQDFLNTAVRGSILLNSKLNSRHTLRTGLIVSHLGFDLTGSSEDEELPDYQVNEIVNNQGSSQLAQGYFQWKYRLTEKLTFNAGMHGLYFALNGNHAIEPRAGLSWELSPTQSLSLGYGQHSRLDAMVTYFAQATDNQGNTFNPNKNLDFTKAQHFVVGYNHRLTEDLNLRVEAYYQQLRNVPIAHESEIDLADRTQSAINAEEGFIATTALSNAGKGKNYGMEITLEKFFTHNWYLMANTSLYQSKYTARDGIERNTRFNGNFIVNTLLGKEWKTGKTKKNLIGFNMKALWAGGNRYTPLDLDQSMQTGDTVYLWNDRYKDRNADYFRLDTRLSFHINKRRTTSVISLDIQNTTNRQNVYGQYFDKDSKTLKTYYQLGLIPILNYRLEF
jgi:hypothetical protein